MRLLRLYLNLSPDSSRACPVERVSTAFRVSPCASARCDASMRSQPSPGADLIDSAAAAHPRAKSIAVAAESAPSVIFRAIVRT